MNPLLKYDSCHKTSKKTVVASRVLDKLGFLLFILTCGSALTAYLEVIGNAAAVNVLTLGGSLCGFALALLIITSQSCSSMLISLYSFLQGLVLGGISARMEQQYPGLVSQALFATITTTGVMYAIHRSQIIKVTTGFISGLLTSMLAILAFYVTAIILQMCGIVLPFLATATPLGIGISVLICIVASLNLLVDFDQIDQAVRDRVDAKYEWYLSFSLIVSLIWMYLEILRLLEQVRSYSEE